MPNEEEDYIDESLVYEIMEDIELDYIDGAVSLISERDSIESETNELLSKLSSTTNYAKKSKRKYISKGSNAYKALAIKSVREMMMLQDKIRVNTDIKGDISTRLNESKVIMLSLRTKCRSDEPINSYSELDDAIKKLHNLMDISSIYDDHEYVERAYDSVEEEYNRLSVD